MILCYYYKILYLYFISRQLFKLCAAEYEKSVKAEEEKHFKIKKTENF